MRIYANLDEMHSETKRNLHSLGILVKPQTMQDKLVADNPDYETLELSPHEFTVLDGTDRNDWLVRNGGNLEWCFLDFQERVSDPYHENITHNPGNAHVLRPEWAEYIHDGKFSYTYSERMGRLLENKRNWNAIRKIVHELTQRPDTRQAILPIFNGDDDLPNMGGKARIPCSLHYQFLIRENELRLIYVMRSSDFYLHFLYDIWHALELQSFVAGAIGREIGRFTFFTGSLHIYRKDAEAGVF